MAVPQSKQELLREINSSFTKLLVDLESISEKDTNLRELEEHKERYIDEYSQFSVLFIGLE